MNVLTAELNPVVVEHDTELAVVKYFDRVACECAEAPLRQFWTKFLHAIAGVRRPEGIIGRSKAVMVWLREARLALPQANRELDSVAGGAGTAPVPGGSKRHAANPQHRTVVIPTSKATLSSEPIAKTKPAYQP